MNASTGYSDTSQAYNQTGSYSNVEINYYQWCSFACGVLLIPIAIFGIIGNVITAFIFFNRNMTSSINVLLVGLAVWDIWLLLTSTPLFTTLAIYIVFPTEQSASATGFLTLYFYPLCLMAQSASAWTMIVISVERYLAVCRPFVALVVCTVKRAAISLTLVFIAAVLYNVCRFYEYTLDEEDPHYHSMKMNLRDNEWYKRIYINWMYLFALFVVPFGFLSVLNSMVIIGLNQAQANRRELSSQQNSEHKTALMMVIVMLIFLLCNFLALILNAIETLKVDLINDHKDLFFLFTDVNNLLVEINSSVNCIVYYYFSQKFRTAFNRLFCPHLKKPMIKKSITFDLPLSTCCGDSVTEQSLLLMSSSRKNTSVVALD